MHSRIDILDFSQIERFLSDFVSCTYCVCSLSISRIRGYDGINSVDDMTYDKVHNLWLGRVRNRCARLVKIVIPPMDFQLKRFLDPLVINYEHSLNKGLFVVFFYTKKEFHDWITCQYGFFLKNELYLALIFWYNWAPGELNITMEVAVWRVLYSKFMPILPADLEGITSIHCYTRDVYHRITYNLVCEDFHMDIKD